MIVEFSVGNFRSIRDVETLNMSAAPIASRYKELDVKNILPVNDKLSLLKSKAIYGANASGKSNIIRAFSNFISLVANSVKDETMLTRFIDAYLLDDEYDEKPTFFQLIFLVDGVLYRYGFEATSEVIVSEWLYGTMGKREVYFFTRENGKVKINEKQFGEASKLKEFVRENALFLTLVKSLNGEIARQLVGAITGIIVISGLTDQTLHAIASQALKDEETRRQIIAMLKIADTGIQGIYRMELDADDDAALIEGNKGKKKSVLISTHKRKQVNSTDLIDVPFSFDFHESEGTKKMFEISPAILQAMEQGRTLLLDEFDARFHPLLTRRLVQLFNSDINKNNAQFIFATHDTNLLDSKLLRRDQICFAEKDTEGASHFYSLAEFKGVRNDASFEKDYIMGKYGAIPFLGDFETLFEENA